MCSGNRHGVQVTYVQIYKVNTQGICSNLYKLDDGSFPTKTFFFTFVREPLERFVSGFSEVMYRDEKRHKLHGANGCGKYRAAKDVGEKVQLFLDAYLGDEIAANSGGKCRYDPHVMPQVAYFAASLDRGEKIRFVGSLATVVEEWKRLERAVRFLAFENSTSSLTWWQAWPAFDTDSWEVRWSPGRTTNPHIHSNSAANSSLRAEMERVVSTDFRRRIALCRALLLDYVCLSFELPVGCEIVETVKKAMPCPLALPHRTFPNATTGSQSLQHEQANRTIVPRAWPRAGKSYHRAKATLSHMSTWYAEIGPRCTDTTVRPNWGLGVRASPRYYTVEECVSVQHEVLGWPDGKCPCAAELAAECSGHRSSCHDHLYVENLWMRPKNSSTTYLQYCPKRVLELQDTVDLYLYLNPAARPASVSLLHFDKLELMRRASRELTDIDTLFFVNHFDRSRSCNGTCCGAAERRVTTMTRELIALHSWRPYECPGHPMLQWRSTGNCTCKHWPQRDYPC